MEKWGPARRERIAVGLLLVCYLVAAGGFAVAVPYGEAPDEPAHLLYVEYLVRNGSLPPIAAGAPSNEAVQPPLYYALGAAVVAAGQALTGDRDPAGRLAPKLRGNPDFFQQRPGTYNVQLHPPEQRWPRWPLVLRLCSILLGAGVIVLTYLTARTLVPPPAPPTVALVATAFAALIPQANFIRASISNENLADLLAAGIVLLLARHLTQAYSGRRVVWLGVAVGLGLLTKLSLVLFVLPVLWVLWLRRGDAAGRLGRDLLACGGVAGVLAGPFYIYRWLAYGDPLASTAWAAMLPADSPWQLTDLFWLTDPFRGMIWSSFWGVYGWQLIWLPGLFYGAFLLVTALGVAGGGYLVVRRALSPAQQAGCAVLLAVLALRYGGVVLFSLRLVAWQGRELFPALSSVCVLLGFGLAALVWGTAAIRPGGALPIRRRLLAAALLPAVTLGLLAANLYSIWLIVPLLNRG
jgi:hypothetical protein